MPWRLGTEAFEVPGISGSPEAQPVVEPTLSALPKLDVGWRELIASPKIGAGNLGSFGKLGFKLYLSACNGSAVGDGFRLVF
jgi:hypothetical protein